jgi:hypothetical protein
MDVLPKPIREIFSKLMSWSKAAVIFHDGKLSWSYELEGSSLAPSVVELLDTVALTSPDVEVMISLFFFVRNLNPIMN